MKVKELTAELLDCEMEAEVYFETDSASYPITEVGSTGHVPWTKTVGLIAEDFDND